LTIEEGTVVGPYRLIRRIGSGGAGVVFQGQFIDGSSDHPIAVKVLHGTAADEAARGIVEQAAAVAALRQPHCIPLYGATDDGGRLAIAMAYAPGGSLADALRSPAEDRVSLPLPVPVVLRLITQLASALDAIHRAGQIHGDLKPENIFVRTAPDGRPIATLADFGQAMLTSMAAHQLTQTSPLNEQQARWARQQMRFAAPEQRDGTGTPASDQYALAALAYYLLTNTTASPSPAGVPAASHMNATVPPQLSAVLARAMAYSPEHRYQSIGQFAREARRAFLEASPSGAQVGVTQEFASLGAAGQAAGKTSSAQQMAISRAATSSARTSRARKRTGTRLTRTLTVLAALAALIGILACALSFRSLAAMDGLPHITLGTSSGSQSTTGNNTQQAPTSSQEARLAEQDWQNITAQSPIFTDSLKSGSKWTARSSSIFIRSDGLHLRNNSSMDVLISDAPVSAYKLPAGVAAQVTVHQVAGNIGDYAGMVVKPANPSDAASFYCYVVSPAGQYAVWARVHDQWNFIQTGFSSSLHTGAGATNTLGILMQPGRRQATLFANGAWVGSVQLPPTSSTRITSVGLIAMDTGSEITFSQFSLFVAPSS